jgi:hypothetical protein
VAARTFASRIYGNERAEGNAASGGRATGELVQGTLDMLVVRTLERGPTHG